VTANIKRAVTSLDGCVSTLTDTLHALTYPRLLDVLAFAYPPLPSTDGLRVLSLLPGELGSVLEGSLASVPFSARPRYIRLPYTWADQNREDVDDQSIPEDMRRSYMILNRKAMPLQRNLCLALHYLRSPTDELPLWVDAACINQADVQERNAQVALMAFIHTRAAAVIS
jgi:hypothetical protein